MPDSDQVLDGAAAAVTAEPQQEVLLSVVVPVFNQAHSIAANVSTIRDALAAGLDGPFEVIVVSDGSMDETAERVLEEHPGDVHVIHYDRNLGKGYAVKIGALEAKGAYVAYIDADLDLHPSSLPEYVHRLESEGLDFAIGSKRHPASQVVYPRARRVASWFYQQLVRVLFRLEVRDTQVGLKVFRREIAEQVLPLLLVKRYAFDLELLAVSRALGFGRIEEQPVRLDYRFTGSGVRSLAVLHALVDTAAIFYRLRLLRYYQKKRSLVGPLGWTRPRHYAPTVTVFGDASLAPSFDPSGVDRIASVSPADWWSAARLADGELLAFFGSGGAPASNWLPATVPFFARSEVSAVVTPSLAPVHGPKRVRAAAGIRESRVGGGSQYYRSIPGNIRFVDDFPADSILVRRSSFLALDEHVVPHDLCERLVEAGGRVLYTPETVVVVTPPPLFAAHLDEVDAYGRERGRAVRRSGLRAVRASTVALLALLLLCLAGWIPAALGATGVGIWLAALAAYGAAVLTASVLVAVRFRSVAVGALAVPGFVASHAAYAVGFARGLAGARRR